MTSQDHFIGQHLPIGGGGPCSLWLQLSASIVCLVRLQASSSAPPPPPPSLTLSFSLNCLDDPVTVRDQLATDDQLT